jgi:FkbM family methyltransferase
VRRHHSKTLDPLFPKPNTELHRIRPLDCGVFVPSVREHHAVKDPNKGSILMVKNATEHFFISIHHKQADSRLKGFTILKTGTYLQRHSTMLIKEVLSNTSHENRFIEVGASYGWFSLLAHKLGIKKVDIFEPNLVNVLRICQSLDANHWLNDSVEIYPYGLTAEDGTVLFQYHDDGSARVNINWGHKSQAFALDSFARERGWLERNDEIISMLKVDVGNHAPQVLTGASEILSSGMVKSLLLYLTIRHKGDKELCQNAIHMLMSIGFQLFLYGSCEEGPEYPNPWLHDADLPINILQAMGKPPNHLDIALYWKFVNE